MTPQQADKIIVEAMGKCWHEFNKVMPKYDNLIGCFKCDEYTHKYEELIGYENDTCVECGRPSPINYPSPSSSWSDYGEVLEWSQKQDWFPMFLAQKEFHKNEIAFEVGYFNDVITKKTMLDNKRGSLALAEFIQQNPKWFKKEVK